MAKAEEKKTTTNIKVFDVHKPGSGVPDASSKPVIVGHKNMLKDPMVKPGEEAVSEVEKLEEKSEKVQIVSSTAPTLQPLTTTEPEVVQDEESDGTGEQPAEVEADKLTEEEKPNAEIPAEEPEANEVNPELSTSSDKAEVAAVAEQVEQQKIDIKKQKVDEEKHAAMEKLAVEKKYYVPIGEKKRKRSAIRIILLILVVLLLGALLFDLLIDAGFIDINIDPPIKIINS